MSESLENLTAKLAKVLKIPNSKDTVEFLLNVKNEADVRDFVYGVLDASRQDHLEVINGLLTKWKQTHIPAFVPPNSSYTVYKKHGESTGNSKNRRNKKGAKEAPEDDFLEEDGSQDGKSKRRTKYVPLFGEGATKADVQLPGRHACTCQATRHQLINNCLKCGKIVCQQEGSGPCLFCGTLVCTNEEEDILCRKSRASQVLLGKLMSKGNAPSVLAKDRPKSLPSRQGDIADEASIHKAVKHKNMLLEFDRTVARRTKVIDDQSDYFSMENRWLSSDEREVLQKRSDELRAKQDANKNCVKFSIDFAGRRLIEEEVDNSNSMYEEELQRLCEESMRKLNLDNDAFDPGLDHLPKPSYDPTYLTNVTVGKATLDVDHQLKTMRLQGKELQEMSDEGWCLSLHQPYATLLVTGLKEHEGRSWFTPIRGRLWIASTAREATLQEINDVQRPIQLLSKNPQVIFPDAYPVGALLGCVELSDCLSQEQYRQTYPNGDSDSPYVFICKSPRELIVKFPIRGQHKIYKLDARIHDAAKKTLRK